MEIIDRLKQYISAKNISIRELERQCEISNGVLGRITKSTSPKTLRRIEANSDLNLDWLFTGIGPMIRPTKEVEVVALGHAKAGIKEEMVEVRFFDLNPTATFQEYCSGDSEEGSLIRIVQMPGDNLDSSACVFEIRGESMAPQIQNRARVLCNEVSPTRWHHVSDGVVVIAYADRFVIKRVIENRLEDKNYLILGSDNPDFPGTEVVQYCDIHCIFCADRIISQPIY